MEQKLKQIFPASLIRRTSIHYGPGLCVEYKATPVDQAHQQPTEHQSAMLQDWRQTQQGLNTPHPQTYVAIDCWTKDCAHPHPYLATIDLQALGVSDVGTHERLHHIVIKPEPGTAMFNNLVAPDTLELIASSIELHIQGTRTRRIEECLQTSKELKIQLPQGQLFI